MYSKHNFLQYATEWGIYRTKEVPNKTKNDVFYVSVSSAHSHYAVNDLTISLYGFLKQALSTGASFFTGIISTQWNGWRKRHTAKN